MGSFPEMHSDPKVPSSGPGQVDFLAGQVTFKAKCKSCELAQRTS